MRWIVLIGLVAVTGYAPHALAAKSARTDWSSRPEPYTTTYLGRTLHCLVVEDGAEAANIGALSCDFARFWRGQ